MNLKRIRNQLQKMMDFMEGTVECFLNYRSNEGHWTCNMPAHPDIFDPRKWVDEDKYNQPIFMLWNQYKSELAFCIVAGDDEGFTKLEMLKEYLEKANKIEHKFEDLIRASIYSYNNWDEKTIPRNVLKEALYWDKLIKCPYCGYIPDPADYEEDYCMEPCGMSNTTKYECRECNKEYRFTGHSITLFKVEMKIGE